MCLLIGPSKKICNGNEIDAAVSECFKNISYQVEYKVVYA